MWTLSSRYYCTIAHLKKIILLFLVHSFSKTLFAFTLKRKSDLMDVKVVK